MFPQKYEKEMFGEEFDYYLDVDITENSFKMKDLVEMAILEFNN